MANTVDTQVIEDGPKFAVLKVYMASDGASGELSDQVVVDASTLWGAPTTLTLNAIWASTTGCSFNLEWDATTDVGIMSFPSDFVEEFCFKKFGGIPNNSGTGKTGDILINTSGFTASGDQITLVLHVKKD